MMPRETLSMDFSSDEARTLLEIYYDRLDSLRNQIRRIDSEIKFTESLISIDDEESEKKMNEAKDKADELKAIHSVKLRFVRYMEKAIEEDDTYINVKVQIMRKKEIDEDCKDCLQFNNETEECSLNKEDELKCRQMRR